MWHGDVTGEQIICCNWVWVAVLHLQNRDHVIKVADLEAQL